METANYIWKLMCGMVVIHFHRLTIPFDDVRMTVTLIEVFVGDFTAVFAKVTVNTIAVESIADQRGMSTC